MQYKIRTIRAGTCRCYNRTKAPEACTCYFQRLPDFPLLKNTVQCAIKNFLFLKKETYKSFQ